MFGLNIIDTPSVGSSGLTATRLAQVKASITAAAEIWGQYIDAPDAVIDLELTFDDIPGTTLATAGSFYFSTGGDYESVVTEELGSNTDVSPGTVDATLRIDLPKVLDDDFYFYDTSFEPNPAGLQQDEFDFLSVIIHEFGHVLGLAIATNFTTPFDAMTQVIGGVNYFTGANAKAANGGQNVALSGSHLEEEDLLDHTIVNGERGLINPVHVGIWEDLGISIVEATGAADTLYGFEAVNDTINGLGGQDVIRGLTGDDVLLGGAGNDTLVGGMGIDTLTGGGDADIFEFGLTDEGAVITDFEAVDQLNFATGTQAQGVLATATQAGADAILIINGTQITLNGVDSGSLVRSGAQITIDETAGGGGPSLGNDIYTYLRSDGDVTISLEEEDATSGNADRLVFSDLDLADVSLSKAGTDLNIAWVDGAQSGSLTLAEGGTHIERFEFADGSVLSAIEIDKFGTADKLSGTSADDLIVGTDGREYVFGGNGADTLDAGGTDGGIQLVFGQGGGDTYLVGKENGSIRMLLNGENDTVHTGTDTVNMIDLALSDMTFSDLGNGDLRMAWNDGTDNGFVQLAEGGSHIERFEFADGSTLSSIEVDRFGTADSLTGTTSDDLIAGTETREYLFGGNGSDTLDAGGTDGGAQLLFGQGGSDTYEVAKENGAIRITRGGENDAVHTGTDTLKMVNLALSEMTFSDLGNDDLRMAWNDGNDNGFVQLADGASHIERFEFADGSTLSKIEVDRFGTADSLTGTTSDDLIAGTETREYLFGGNGSDTLDAGGTDGGAQLLFGQGGSDTYEVAKENGAVRINRGGENDAVHTGTDTLKMANLALSEMTFSELGNGDLRMAWNDGTDIGFVQLADGGSHIERFEFADGSTLSKIEIDRFGTADSLTGTTSDDLIVGTDTREYLLGGNGADTLNAGGTDGGVQLLFGQGGSDTYEVAKENGGVRIIRGGENDAVHTGTDTLHFTNLNQADLSQLTLGNGDVRLSWNDGTDTGYAQLADGGQNIEEFKFADGTLLTFDEFFV